MDSEQGLEAQIRDLRLTINEYIEVSLESQRKKRAENIQVLVSLGIIGAFFTDQFQNLIAGTSFESFTDLVVLFSGVFLLSKVTLPTIRITKNSDKLEWFDQVALPFLYTFSVILGALVMFYLWIPPFSALTSSVSGGLSKILILVIAGLLSTLGAIKQRENYKYARRRENSLRDKVKRPSESRIINYLKNNPEKMMEGIQNVDRSLEGGTESPDFMAEDGDGRPIIIEVERGIAGINALKRLDTYTKAHGARNKGEARGLLVAQNITARAESEIEERDLEFVRLNFEELLDDRIEN